MNALVSWLGAGGQPVSIEKAEHRASFCVGCPLNTHGKWWENAKTPIAAMIRKILALKAHQKLSVSQEEQLFMCSACGCALRLKVFAPIKHISDNLTPEMLDKLDENCWIRKELP